MAGDVIDLRTKAYYKNDGTNTNPASVDQIISDLVGAFLGNGSSTVPNGKGNLQQGNGSILNTADLNAFTNTNQQNNNDLSSAPKAYLNYLLFDANFNLVGGYVKRVDGTLDSLVTYNGHVDVSASGYLVAYTSNESPRNVWFDDIEVTHQSGPLLQESTLYPYGMEIASQSNRPIIQTANVQLFQGKELDEEFDINTYDFGSRTYDPQTGRFLSSDPARQFASGYVGMGNNPVMFTDPDGRFIPLLIIAAGAVIGGVTNVVSHWSEISSASNLTQAILRGAGYTVVGGVLGLCMRPEMLLAGQHLLLLVMGLWI
jgi:RHS repeat-associated protein